MSTKTYHKEKQDYENRLKAQATEMQKLKDDLSDKTTKLNNAERDKKAGIAQYKFKYETEKKKNEEMEKIKKESRELKGQLSDYIILKTRMKSDNDEIKALKDKLKFREETLGDLETLVIPKYKQTILDHEANFRELVDSKNVGQAIGQSLETTNNNTITRPAARIIKNKIKVNSVSVLQSKCKRKLLNELIDLIKIKMDDVNYEQERLHLGEIHNPLVKELIQLLDRKFNKTTNSNSNTIEDDSHQTSIEHYEHQNTKENCKLIKIKQLSDRLEETFKQQGIFNAYKSAWNHDEEAIIMADINFLIKLVNSLCLVSLSMKEEIGENDNTIRRGQVDVEGQERAETSTGLSPLQISRLNDDFIFEYKEEEARSSATLSRSDSVPLFNSDINIKATVPTKDEMNEIQIQNVNVESITEPDSDPDQKNPRDQLLNYIKDDECCICYETYGSKVENGREIKRYEMECKHHCCESCFESWSKGQIATSCPTCRGTNVDKNAFPLPLGSV